MLRFTGASGEIHLAAILGPSWFLTLEPKRCVEELKSRWPPGEHKARTDVDEMPLAVQHDVAVVSVLDLQQEQQEAVSGHAADEVVPCLRGERGGEKGLHLMQAHHNMLTFNTCVLTYKHHDGHPL